MINIQGMDPSAYSRSKHKLTCLREEHIDSKVPFLAICESWLKPHISDAQVNIPNYQILRQDRIKRKRGGVVLYVHDSLPTSKVSTFDDDHCGSVMCYIKSLNAIVASIYRPPGTAVNSFEKLLKFTQRNINEIIDKSKPHCDIFIMGDFNPTDMSWNQGGSALLLSQFMENNFLTQVIDKPTRQNNILDLFITNNSNIVLQTDTVDTSLSDHRIVEIKTTYNLLTTQAKNKPYFPEHSFRSINFQKASYSDISAHLKTIDWEELKGLCSPDEFPELFRLTLLQISMLYSPPKSKQSNKSNPFVRSRNVLRRRKRKVKAQIHSLEVKNSTSKKIDKLRAELYDINTKIKVSINNQRQLKESKAVNSIKDNSRYFYSFAKQNNKLKSTVGPLTTHEGGLTDDPKCMADILQNQYSSVFSDPLSSKKENPDIKCNLKSTLENFDFSCEDIESAINEINEHSACGANDIPAVLLKKCKTDLSYPILLIWRDSLHTGYVPKVFKNQIITPVHKKASKAEPENYRPISLTSHIIKLFERIMRKHIVRHLKENDLICKNQHGFQQGKSCLTQLLPHIDFILQNFLNNTDTDVIYLDFAKAFDKVDHVILLKKLYAHGIRGKVLMWLHSYLTNRWQTVVINGEHSKPAKVISGVPQGTVLGPILFIIYLNDLESCIKNSVASSFADDTRLKKSINSTNDTKLLQEDLTHAVEWSDKANMKLHQSKFELLCHNTDNCKLVQELPFSQELSEYITSDGSSISPSEAVRDLGITITPDAGWSLHISKIVDDARRMSAWVLSVFIDRSAEILVPLFKSLVRSKTEYCCPLWHPSKMEDIMKLEAVQRAFTSKIREVQQFSYWDRLKCLNLMSLQRRRERYILIHVFKIINKLAPNDLQMKFYNNDRRGICCILPPLVRNSKSKYQHQYDNSFPIVGGKLWNLLPKRITLKRSLMSFKTALSKFIQQVPDHPPVPGIASDNSLLTLLASGRYTWRNSTHYDGGLAASDDDSEDDSEDDRIQMAGDL